MHGISFDREEVDKIHDQAQWKLEIEGELEEMREEYEEEFEQKKITYEQLMKEVKKQKEAKVWQTICYKTCFRRI